MFTGSLDEAVRLGVVAWLDSDTYMDQYAEDVEEWGRTLWTIWSAQTSAAKNGAFDCLGRVPREVSAMDCWKPWVDASTEDVASNAV